MPAQPGTYGKRLAMFGEELLVAFKDLESTIENYAIRGLKGPVGTQVDLLSLFDGDSEKVISLERSILKHLGLNNVLNVVGQVYPCLLYTSDAADD